MIVPAVGSNPTPAAEEVIECVRNILDSIGHGECKDCICDIIPHLCQEKMIVPAVGSNPTPTTNGRGGSCPGGSLDGCISLCPQNDGEMFQECVQQCIADCV